MSGLLSHIKQNIRSRHLFSQGEWILVAVSGGLDSMVLLNALHQLSSENRWRLIVAHLNHSLRGRSSMADEALVRRTAERLALPLRVETLDVRTTARTNKLSIEMAAREVRHGFLARMAASEEVRKVALAHHADDQVELFFLRLFRGSGGEGMAGMKWVGPSPVNREISLVRPLLNLPKSALAEFAAEQGIEYREDRTNVESDFLRNRIRNELLPLLHRDYQPGLNKSVLRIMEILRAEAEFARKAAQEWLEQANLSFDNLPVAVQRHALLEQLLALGIPVDFELLEKLRLEPETRVVFLGGAVILRDIRGRLRLAVPEPSTFLAGEKILNLGQRKGEAVFDGVRFQWQLLAQQAFERPGPMVDKEWFDAEAVGNEVILRHWRPGDRFQPIGLKSPVKIQDIFTNHKVLRKERHERILATTRQGEVFWVEGLRISERYKLTESTKHRLQWRWKRL